MQMIPIYVYMTHSKIQIFRTECKWRFACSTYLSMNLHVIGHFLSIKTDVLLNFL